MAFIMFPISFQYLSNISPIGCPESVQEFFHRLSGMSHPGLVFFFAFWGWNNQNEDVRIGEVKPKRMVVPGVDD